MQNQKFSNTVYFDTNILMDILDNKRTGHRDVFKLLELLFSKNIKILINEDMLSTIYYLVKDKEKVLKFFEVILNDWIVVPFEKEIIKKAIKISLEKSVDFENVLQCLCAKKYNCMALITCDKKFIDYGIKIANYNEAIHLLTKY
ncbi:MULTISPECIES: type II toxin-antitoxin system VapC family toxin [unclassified Nitratiruptor]|uniref:type II toxin-antitoxin system VapC family toxin n=1 Tax=unclassified Nitratiruptor TaxID=2624044 RepID=UPI00191685B8|nr:MULTISPECIES: type II toxin-antitoxin system VapC family toxin [unclassified Nitratiruptor]